MISTTLRWHLLLVRPQMDRLPLFILLTRLPFQPVLQLQALDSLRSVAAHLDQALHARLLVHFHQTLITQRHLPKCNTLSVNTQVLLSNGARTLQRLVPNTTQARGRQTTSHQQGPRVGSSTNTGRPSRPSARLNPKYRSREQRVKVNNAMGQSSHLQTTELPNTKMCTMLHF